MGVEWGNIFEVKTLNGDEVKLLFRSRLGKVIKDDQEEVESRMLSKCGGLPLSIVALADVLKHQEFSMWENFATELDKSILNQGNVIALHRHTYSILETSYNLLESEEKKRFFLLGCLFPFGSRIPIEEMMRYGIGLGLFQHVNDLTEAKEQAHTWANELISSSLLLEDDKDKDHVKIHDLVRASTISLTEKGGDMVKVEAFPRWMWKETYQKYYVIALMPDSDHSHLGTELNFNNL
ncbi:unnamed protein product [Amaranthus hypochondriacus]